LISLLKINVFPSLKGYVVSGRIVCVIKTGGVGYNLQFDKYGKTRIYIYIYIYVYIYIYICID